MLQSTPAMARLRQLRPACWLLLLVMLLRTAAVSGAETERTPTRGTEVPLPAAEDVFKDALVLPVPSPKAKLLLRFCREIQSRKTFTFADLQSDVPPEEMVKFMSAHIKKFLSGTLDEVMADQCQIINRVLESMPRLWTRPVSPVETDSPVSEDLQTQHLAEPQPRSIPEPQPRSIPEPQQRAVPKQNIKLQLQPFPKLKPQPLPELRPQPLSEALQPSIPEPHPRPVPKPMIVVQQQPFPEPQEQPFPEPQEQPLSELQQQPFSEPQQQPFSEPQQQPFSEPQQQPFSELQQQPFPEPLQTIPELQQQPFPEPLQTIPELHDRDLCRYPSYENKNCLKRFFWFEELEKFNSLTSYLKFPFMEKIYEAFKEFFGCLNVTNDAAAPEQLNCSSVHMVSEEAEQFWKFCVPQPHGQLLWPLVKHFVLTSPTMKEQMRTAATGVEQWLDDVVVRHKRSITSQCRQHLSVPDCGIRQVESRQKRVVNGVVSPYGRWPWMVQVFITNFATIFGRCGGSLISDQVVVTAAHCLFVHEDIFTEPLLYVTVTLGDPRSGVLSILAKSLLVVKGFKHQIYLHDLALVVLEEPIEFSDTVQPICLPEEGESFTRETAIITGYGITRAGQDLQSDVLREAAVSVVSNEDCQEWYLQGDRPTAFTPPNGTFCAGYRDGRADACKGDSGGPLMLEDQCGRWVLAGITSHGFGCGLPNKPGVYTDVASHRTWLRSNLRAIWQVEQSAQLWHRLGLPKDTLSDSHWEAELEEISILKKLRRDV